MTIGKSTRQFNGWQRLSIVLSVLWAVPVAAIAYTNSSQDIDRSAREYAIEQSVSGKHNACIEANRRADEMGLYMPACKDGSKVCKPFERNWGNTQLPLGTTFTEQAGIASLGDANADDANLKIVARLVCGASSTGTPIVGSVKKAADLNRSMWEQ